MDENAMDGTYTDFVAHAKETSKVEKSLSERYFAGLTPEEEKELREQASRNESQETVWATSEAYPERHLADVSALGQEPNALADQEQDPTAYVVSQELEDRIGEVVKEMIDAGNYFWAGRVADALANNPKKD